MYPLHIHQKTEMEKKATSSIGEDMELLATGTLKILVLKTSLGTNHLGKFCQYLFSSVSIDACSILSVILLPNIYSKEIWTRLHPKTSTSCIVSNSQVQEATQICLMVECIHTGGICTLYNTKTMTKLKQRATSVMLGDRRQPPKNSYCMIPFL